MARGLLATGAGPAVGSASAAAKLGNRSAHNQSTTGKDNKGKQPRKRSTIRCHAIQQQHSILSQASWGRLEIKPKRDEKQRDT
uniref:Uncharacterized protein n=1 Tax=Saccharum hybrid cultivar R570 TaxID=131158 RepID=A0A059Q2F5_9POAL|nr:hypothetical protein SHCRBa_176_L06_F_130 [Saccharum hybrid cultivar R570]